jgi:hypothetical protein
MRVNTIHTNRKNDYLQAISLLTAVLAVAYSAGIVENMNRSPLVLLAGVVN